MIMMPYAELAHRCSSQSMQTSDTHKVAGVNARQLSGAIDYVYLRPGSRLPDTVRSFAQQRKNAFGTETA